VAAPILLCGFGHVGRRVLESLRSVGATVIVIDQKPKPEDRIYADLEYIHGDCRLPEVLKKAGIESARGIVIVTSDDLVNVSTALVARSLNPTARVVVRMFNQNLITRLSGAMKNTVALSVSALAAPFIALTAVAGDTLAAVKFQDSALQIVEATLTKDSPLVGRPLGEAAGEARLLVIAYRRGDAPTEALHAVRPDAVLQAGDTLVVCGQPDDVGILNRKASDTDDDGVLWAGRIRRFYRTIRRTLAEVDLSVKIATSTLFLTLFISSMIFRYGVGSEWADAIYQTVSVAATGAELHGENKSGEVKIFLSILKIAGAALIAAFTAIFTQYLLRAKLGGAFETHKIPDAGHVVVCGLGNIGFRCVEELLRLKYSVVAIDKAADAPFASTVRRMGAAVIFGDATVSEVLKQARAETARAVVAVTSAELANLEIGLLARELNPAQRIIVRLSDPEFAKAVRDAADIHHAFSVPAFAGPAFASALFGERVQAIFSVGSATLAVCDIVVKADDSRFVGRPLGELSLEYRFLPLGLAGGEPFSEIGIPNDQPLKADDRMTVILQLDDLERLIREEVQPAAS
jgi:Trk K+ transport system NAD-binding subunit